MNVRFAALAALLAACGNTTASPSSNSVADSAAGESIDSSLASDGSAALGSDGATPSTTDSMAQDLRAQAIEGGNDVTAERSPTDARSEGNSATYAAVQAIFDDQCTTCHLTAAVGLPGAAPMALTADVSYPLLVGKAATETCGGIRVVPGDSASSYLIHKLTEDVPCSGARMPRPSEFGPANRLDATAIATIRRWIDEGAHP